MFSVRAHHFSLTPKKSSVSYQLKLVNGTNVSVEFPWLVSSLRNFSSSDEFMKSYYASNGNDDKREEKMLKKKMNKRSDWTNIEYSNIDGLGFYQLDNRTLVWYQNNFEVNNECFNTVEASYFIFFTYFSLAFRL